MATTTPSRTRRRVAWRMGAAFVAVLVVAELGARAVGPALPEPSRHYHHLAQVKSEQLEALGGTHLDAVFAGTSQTYYAVDPAVVDRTIGTTTYNAAVPAGVPPIQERWLFEEVLPRVDTDVVVWGLSILDLNDGRDASVIDAYDRSMAGRQGLLAEADRRLAERLALFRHRRQLVDPETWEQVRSGSDPVRGARSTLEPHGQLRTSTGHLHEAERARVRDDVVADYRFGGPMIESLERTVVSLHERDIEVVLVWLPVPDRLVELLDDPGMVEEAADHLRRRAAELGVDVIDLSDGIDDDDFVDYTHLGEVAARSLSRRLGVRLTEVGVGPTNRSTSLPAALSTP